ncbi:MAG TPA: hypothetical protein VFB60_20625 [Ktedonobacteraceae bacterium]|nr:hypothetical protein [Ktedonobacteraceae bacterium]
MTTPLQLCSDEEYRDDIPTISHALEEEIWDIPQVKAAHPEKTKT